MIKDLKELPALLKLCRKQGVTEITLGAVSIRFGEMPKKPVESDEPEDPITDELTPEQLMFFSAGGIPP